MTVEELYNWAIKHNATDLELAYNDSECGGYYYATIVEVLHEKDREPVVKLDCN